MSGINGRILEKSNYSAETLKTYGFLSAYFIDLFYNHLYDQAIRYQRQNQVSTVTDGYKCSLDAFLQSINKHDPELYRDLVNGIYQQFINYGYTGLTYMNCIDKIVKEFVPQDYWKVLSFDDKSWVLGTVITNSTKEMIYKIISGFLADVIDNHDEPENTNLWQDVFIDILIIEREKLYQHIVNVKTGGDHSLIDTMKKEIKLLYTEKATLQLKNIDMKKEILSLNKSALDFHKLLKESNDKNDNLYSLFEEYKALHADQNINAGNQNTMTNDDDGISVAQVASSPSSWYSSAAPVASTYQAAPVASPYQAAPVASTYPSYRSASPYPVADESYESDPADLVESGTHVAASRDLELDDDLYILED